MKVNSFLQCGTPDSWLAQVQGNLPTLLIDHANCEKKAASTALNLIYRYVDKPKLMLQLSKLAREELRHFEQVLAVLRRRDIEYVHVSPSRYAAGLREGVRTFEPARLIDILVVSAIVEARSCERFSRIIAVLDSELAQFYTSLLKSEARHFDVYLKMAWQYADEPIDDRIEYFLDLDQRLVESPDEQFRFHSGIPMSC
jgi:tRNA 2-(methylsulfanyl)-N6-isopentenyladenosine37 hydroxylase